MKLSQPHRCFSSAPTECHSGLLIRKRGTRKIDAPESSGFSRFHPRLDEIAARLRTVFASFCILFPLGRTGKRRSPVGCPCAKMTNRCRVMPRGILIHPTARCGEPALQYHRLGGGCDEPTPAHSQSWPDNECRIASLRWPFSSYQVLARWCKAFPE